MLCPSIKEGCCYPEICTAEGRCNYTGSPFNDAMCQQMLKSAGLPYPRTCRTCGLFGPCRYKFPTIPSEPPAPAPPAKKLDVLDEIQRICEQTHDRPYTALSLIHNLVLEAKR